MKPQTPPPPGKSFCVSRESTIFAFFPGGEAHKMYNKLVEDDAALPPFDEGIVNALWEWDGSQWIAIDTSPTQPKDQV